MDRELGVMFVGLIGIVLILLIGGCAAWVFKRDREEKQKEKELAIISEIFAEYPELEDSGRKFRRFMGKYLRKLGEKTRVLEFQAE